MYRLILLKGKVGEHVGAYNCKTNTLFDDSAFREGSQGILRFEKELKAEQNSNFFTTFEDSS